MSTFKRSGSRSKPRILLISPAIGWLGISRLPKALTQEGAEVFALHHERSWLRHTSWLAQRRTFPDTFSRLGMLQRICRAILDWKPDLIIPGDDEITPFLFRFWARLAQSRRLLLKGPFAQILKSFDRSFGGLEHVEARYLRHQFMLLAQDLGVLIPEAITTADWQVACRFAERHRFPIVVKKEHSAGGGGVRFCHTPEEIREAFTYLQQPPARWGLWRRMESWLPPALRTFDVPFSPELTIQSFVQGETCMCITVAHEGRILGGITLAKEQVYPPPTGPSSIVRYMTHEGVESATEKLIRAMRFTGISGVEFVICKDTQRAYVIELNPRPTPSIHLGPLFGQNLLAALLSIAKGTPQPCEILPPTHEKVVLYPQELLRDSQSHYFQKYYHDIPTNDPVLEKELALYVEERLHKKN